MHSNKKYFTPRRNLTREWNACKLPLNERNITTSLSIIHSVVHHVKVGSSSIDKPFVNHGPSNMLFHFFRCLIYVYFDEAFVKNVMKKRTFFKYIFPKFFSRCSILQNIRISNLVILKWWPFRKRSLSFRSEIGIFNLFCKSLNKKVLKIYKSAVIENFQTRSTMSYKAAL